ncbi:alpha/beta fold hydrolase [Streptomyces sp. NPDC056465]|uniref:alpha/beta fold hydrolase n=1 Tax=Streptomyces sp. NPDC056465 TaxID=3345829 RepID=UPI0036B8CE41
MSTFILVSGMFTGPHVWEETAARLTATGAAVHAVALTGLGGARPPAGTDVDLETHIADVLAVIDSVGRAEGEGRAGSEGRTEGEGRAGSEEIVLVGHDYGIHPAVGAADRRSDSIARIVHLDSGLPQNGVPALAAVADQGLREAAVDAAQGAGASLPPPPRDGWRHWGSTVGVPDAALDRLTALASPQPLGTLTQPLRLTGAAATVPMTGVLCTGGGASIAMVQARADLGEPVLRALADARVAFLELPTGHWPMLSAPTELAVTLLRAAAGEGRRLTPVDAARQPAHLRPFLLEVPEVPRERAGHVDLYVPPSAEGPLPAVVFVHGGPVPAEARPTPRDWPLLTGYARLAAGRGAVGVTLDHSLHSVDDYARAAGDLAAAVEQVRADPRVDADRIALWFFSGSGPLTADWLGKPPSWLRCLAANYPIMAALPAWGRIGSRFSPAEAVAQAGSLPLVLVRAGLEAAEIAATVAEFLAAADACGADIEVVDVPDGHHTFEAVDPTDASRDAVHRAMRSVLRHLRA